MRGPTGPSWQTFPFTSRFKGFHSFPTSRSHCGAGACGSGGIGILHAALVLSCWAVLVHIQVGPEFRHHPPRLGIVIIVGNRGRIPRDTPRTDGTCSIGTGPRLVFTDMPAGVCRIRSLCRKRAGQRPVPRAAIGHRHVQKRSVTARGLWPIHFTTHWARADHHGSGRAGIEQNPFSVWPRSRSAASGRSRSAAPPL